MNKRRLIIFTLITLAVLSLGICIAVFTPVPIPAGVENMVRVYTRNKPDAKITVAVITPEGTETYAYGHDGIRIPVPEISYEIGDITKTFTGAIAAKAVMDGILSPTARISDILPLSRAVYSPTVFELLTHSSAYSSYAPGISRAEGFIGRNPYEGISANDVVSQTFGFKLTYEPPYLYSYSNFGTAVAGAAISKLYDVDFYSILTIFAQEELGLRHTWVDLEGELDHGWAWKDTDAYLASHGLSSTIGDMVANARLYLNGGHEFLNLAAEPMVEINADNSVGYFWNVTNSGNILWHSGETGHYASQIMIDRNRHIAVIILSNYGNDRYGNIREIGFALMDEVENAA